MSAWRKENPSSAGEGKSRGEGARGGEGREGSGPGPGEAPESGEGRTPAVDVEALRAERDDWEGKYKRVLADYQNSQRRAVENEAEARRRGVSAVVESVITALDHFEKALSQDASKMTAEQLVEGVRLIHDELVRAVSRHGAGLIEPKVGDEFDPMRHQAVARREVEGLGAGRVAELLQRGYTVGERTVRPAMVVVSGGGE